MNKQEKEPDLASWFSTYGLLTAERILEGFQVHLTQDEIATAIKQADNIYFQLLRIPMKNVFNGIILQQAHDYQVYAQKLFIDYLLSGQSDKEKGSPGANTREELEEERTKLVAMGETFNQCESDHLKLIAETQAHQIKLAHDFQQSLLRITKQISGILKAEQLSKSDESIQRAIRAAMIYYDKGDQISKVFWSKMAEALDVSLPDETCAKLAEVFGALSEYQDKIDRIVTTYLEQTEEIGLNFRNYRRQFYELILRGNELVKQLPDYHQNKERDAENRSSLYFDTKLGEQGEFK